MEGFWVPVTNSGLGAFFLPGAAWAYEPLTTKKKKKVAVGSEQCWFELPWVADRQTDGQKSKKRTKKPTAHGGEEQHGHGGEEQHGEDGKQG